MKKDARRLGFFAILLAAVLASVPIGATTVLFQQGSTQKDVASSIPHLPLDALVPLALPDGPSTYFPAATLVDWPKDTVPGELEFGTLPVLSPIPTESKSDRPSAAVDLNSSRPRLSEGEMAVWKSNDEPENRLFRMQFAKASVYEVPEPSPLIPIPEPTTGVLVLMGLAGRMVLNRFDGSANHDA